MSRTAGKAPQRIAHVLPWPTPGGTEHGTLRLAKAIDSSRFTSIAFCLPEATQVRALFEGAGIPCATYHAVAHSYRHASTFLRESLKLAREFARQRVQVVHCSDLLAAYYAALAGWLAHVPVVTHIRGRFDRLSRRDRSFLWPVSQFIFVSESTWRHFGYSVPSRRGVVVYDGIDVPDHPGDDAARTNVRAEFNIPENAPIVGMTARVAPPKDFVTLARAAARVLSARPNVRFMIVGDHSSNETHRRYYGEVQRVVRECGVERAFVFTGYRADVQRIVAAFDVFVLSTHWEGLPLVILEAMALARPVVATAVDGIPEVIRDQHTGLLFPPEDADRLAAQVLDLLQDVEKAMRIGEAGRALVRSEFSTERFARRMNALYDALL